MTNNPHLTITLNLSEQVFSISGQPVIAENGRQFLDNSATQISRRDVAKYMLDIIKETSVYKACVAIGYGKKN